MKKSKQYQYRKAHTSRKVKIIRWINIILILVMFIVVIHDSFVHALPFYYILFFIGGFVIGQFLATSQKFSVKEDDKLLYIVTNHTSIAITLILLAIRFFAGKLILEELHVVQAADALYLLFVGIYFAKVKRIVSEIDERVYSKLFED